MLSMAWVSLLIGPPAGDGRRRCCCFAVDVRQSICKVLYPADDMGRFFADTFRAPTTGKPERRRGRSATCRAGRSRIRERGRACCSMLRSARAG